MSYRDGPEELEHGGGGLSLPPAGDDGGGWDPDDVGCECSYGYFLGGDPRTFEPDASPPGDMSTPEERELHAKDCAWWAAGERDGFPLTGFCGYGMGITKCELCREKEGTP